MRQPLATIFRLVCLKTAHFFFLSQINNRKNYAGHGFLLNNLGRQHFSGVTVIGYMKSDLQFYYLNVVLNFCLNHSFWILLIRSSRKM